MSSLQTVEDIARFLANGGVPAVLAKTATVRADAVIAIDKSIDALNAWKLVLTRAGEIEDIAKEKMK